MVVLFGMLGTRACLGWARSQFRSTGSEGERREYSRVREVTAGEGRQREQETTDEKTDDCAALRRVYPPLFSRPRSKRAGHHTHGTGAARPVILIPSSLPLAPGLPGARSAPSRLSPRVVRPSGGHDKVSCIKVA
ncbi:hypothetical protein B0T11DRAFT_278727 [Plectosphaerella cucumerina]|uniref:Uncharacterized protein n=1 Tax=Plectosphaerella cucumerina TaxID=40658 RepID=A0A8K0TQA3_9PEZI|nr:hypothetical protein B0T11DRAFT_278727 [Plectosphaerella cucumerina]